MEPVESTGNSGAAIVDLPQPEPASTPSWWALGDVAKCDDCSKTRPHTIVRLNVTGHPTLCDPCHDERTKR